MLFHVLVKGYCYQNKQLKAFITTFWYVQYLYCLCSAPEKSPCQPQGPHTTQSSVFCVTGSPCAGHWANEAQHSWAGNVCRYRNAALIKFLLSSGELYLSSLHKVIYVCLRWCQHDNVNSVTYLKVILSSFRLQECCKTFVTWLNEANGWIMELKNGTKEDIAHSKQ